MAAEAQHLDSNTDGVTLLTAKGGSFGGDAVIAADGLWSSLRGAAFPRRPPPAYTGRAALRAVIPAEALPEALESTATHLWLATGAHAVHYPVRGGAEIAMVLIIEDPEAIEGWGREVSGEAMRTIAGRLPAPLAALTTLSNDWRKWSLYAMRGSGLRPWVSGRLALMGDAAHPVLPFLAQGGVLALEDAAVLARSISEGSGDIPAALADYERARRWRAARVARASARNGRIYHLSGLAARARDAVLTGTSGERLMRGWDWLYGWRA
jgi:salicylate hydroxylase